LLPAKFAQLDRPLGGEQPGALGACQWVNCRPGLGDLRRAIKLGEPLAYRRDGLLPSQFAIGALPRLMTTAQPSQSDTPRTSAEE
jgi:hypothetical protein